MKTQASLADDSTVQGLRLSKPLGTVLPACEGDPQAVDKERDIPINSQPSDGFLEDQSTEVGGVLTGRLCPPFRRTVLDFWINRTGRNRRLRG